MKVVVRNHDVFLSTVCAFLQATSHFKRFACGNVFIHWLQFLQGCYQPYDERIPSNMVPSSISFWCLNSLNVFLQATPTPWHAQMCPSVTPLEVAEQAVSGIG